MQRIALLLLLMVPLTGATPRGLLTEIGRPELLEIAGDYLFLMEGATIYQYRLGDFRFVRRFCRTGEGPGELKVIPSIVNYLVPLKNSILAVGMDKAIEFSLDGTVVREFRIPQFTNYLRPLGTGFLVMRFKTGEQRVPDMEVLLTDAELKPRRTLYSQKMSGGRNRLNLTFDGIFIAVTSKGIYIDRSPEGFRIARFNPDGSGETLIRRPFSPIPFTAERRAAAIERIKANPEIKRIGWENIRDAVEIVHDDYFPLIQDLTADGDTLWVMTAEQRDDGRIAFLRLNPRGEVIGKVYLPVPLDTGFTNQILGRPARLFRFHKGRYYYLRENENEECWQILSEAY